MNSVESKCEFASGQLTHIEFQRSLAEFINSGVNHLKKCTSGDRYFSDTYEHSQYLMRNFRDLAN